MQQQPGDPRAELEGRLGQLYDLLRRIDDLRQQEEAIFARHAHRYVGYLNRWRAGAYWLWTLMLTLVLSVVALGVFVATFVATSDTVPTDAVPSDDRWVPQFLSLFVFFLPLPIALVASAIILGVRNARVAGVNERRRQTNRERAAEIQQLVAPELAPFEANLAQVRDEFDSRFRGWFPERYLTAEDVAACWRLVNDHRASTVSEAIREYETVLHRQRMENAALAQLAEQQRATRVAMLGNVINAVGHASTAGAIRSEGAATRSAFNARRNF
jgi:hypothetical protein